MQTLYDQYCKRFRDILYRTFIQVLNPIKNFLHENFSHSIIFCNHTLTAIILIMDDASKSTSNLTLVLGKPIWRSLYGNQTVCYGDTITHTWQRYLITTKFSQMSFSYKPSKLEHLGNFHPLLIGHKACYHYK